MSLIILDCSFQGPIGQSALVFCEFGEFEALIVPYIYILHDGHRAHLVLSLLTLLAHIAHIDLLTLLTLLTLTPRPLQVYESEQTGFYDASRSSDPISTGWRVREI